MENEELKQVPGKFSKKSDYLLSASFLVSAVLIGGALIYGAGLKNSENNVRKENSGAPVSDFEEKVISSVGVEIPAKWGNLGKRMIEAGVIDEQKFVAIYKERGGLSDEDKKLLYSENNGNLTINSGNAGYLLNLLWALGLANKNEILENGPMTNPQYGGAGNFASTGGWTISKGDAMNYYSKYGFIVLTPEQQMLVENVSKNIYRPCCNNSTYFPDCNHGMAMLGLLELMASQGASEDGMYKTALAVNSYWFPDTYLTIAKYFENQGIDWSEIDAKKILGADFSSGSGYRSILSKVEPQKNKGGGGCGV